MHHARPPRRRSPGYVREWSSKALHAVAHKMNHTRCTADLSEHQEWLYDAIISELEYRRRHARPIWSACACMFCIPPFPDQE
jgi:hypothetical protein